MGEFLQIFGALALLAMVGSLAWYFFSVVRARSLEADRIATLSRIGMQITATLDLEQAFDRLYNSVNDLMDAHTFGIGIFDERRQQIDFALANEGGKRYHPYTRTMVDKNQLAVQCIEHRQTICINSFSEVNRYIKYQPEIEEGHTFVDSTETSKRIESYLYVPILLKDRVIGILSVQSLRPGAYRPIHVDMMQTFASYTAIAIDNARAHARLADAVAKLKETQEQLIVHETLASLGTLTAGVAHEINNPTNFVRVAAQNLEADLKEFGTFLLNLAGEDADPQIIETINERIDSLTDPLQTIVEGSERIARIVDDLRTYSRPQQDADPVPVRVADGLNSTLHLVKTNYPTEIDFRTDFASDPQVLAQPAQLNQVFMNLLVNACHAVIDKHGNVGGVINVGLQQVVDELLITIRDNGCGMPAEVREKVFEPFFTTKAPGEGTGMGLSISQGIIERLGGTMTVESAPDQGTCFTIALPLLGKQRRNPESPRQLGSASRQGTP